jgi:hypothetical protein
MTSSPPDPDDPLVPDPNNPDAPIVDPDEVPAVGPELEQPERTPDPAAGPGVPFGTP